MSGRIRWVPGAMDGAFSHHGGGSADRTSTEDVADLRAAVPTCPGWTVADLTRHVGHVYLHKTLDMRQGGEPEDWPPKELADSEPLDLFDRAYAALVAELATGQQLAPVPADLAVDGIDELLTVFVAFGVTAWAEYFTDVLAAHQAARSI